MTMADLPLLVFPNPTRAGRTRRRGFAGSVRRPNVADQGQRLAPKFDRLQAAMDGKRVALQDNPIGIRPEQVLVLETVGSIQDFANIYRWTDGLQWLGEFEQGDLEPDYGFQDEVNPERQLRGQLFLIMSDQSALEQLRSLFDGWRTDPDRQFPYGLGKLKTAFAHLYDIRPWGQKIGYWKLVYLKTGKVDSSAMIKQSHLKSNYGSGLTIIDVIRPSLTLGASSSRWMVRLFSNA